MDQPVHRPDLRHHPGKAGAYGVAVTAADTTGSSGSATFAWVVHNTVTVTNPGTQDSVAGTAVSLQIHASDSDAGETLSYTAAGLPPGLSIGPPSGLISGTVRPRRRSPLLPPSRSQPETPLLRPDPRRLPGK